MTAGQAVLALTGVALAAAVAAVLVPHRPAAPGARGVADDGAAARPARRLWSLTAARLALKAAHSPVSLATLLITAGGVVALTYAGLRLLTDSTALSLTAACAIGLVAVWQYLRFGQRQYRADFRRQFLPALEIIIRGLRSGMPLMPALQVVHKEIGGAVRVEFRRLLDDLAFGLTLSQAVDRLAERMPTTEVQFFAVVIGLQAKTGGRLFEALSNLAGTLRAREQLDLRIRTVTQETRTSALIIACLPVVMMVGLYILSPQYISHLFIHPIGQGVLAVSGLWMALGTWLMKRMTVIHV